MHCLPLTMLLENKNKYSHSSTKRPAKRADPLPRVVALASREAVLVAEEKSMVECREALQKSEAKNEEDKKASCDNGNKNELLQQKNASAEAEKKTAQGHAKEAEVIRESTHKRIREAQMPLRFRKPVENPRCKI